MIRFLLFVPLFLLLLTSTPSTSSALEQQLTPDSAGSLERIARALEALVRLQEQQTSNERREERQLRKLEIAISYLNFRSRRIELLDQDLNVMKSDQRRIEDALNTWQEREDLLLREIEGKPSEQREDLELSLKELQLRIKGLEQRRDSLEEEIIIQKNRIVDLQDELTAVESYVQQHLKL